MKMFKPPLFAAGFVHPGNQLIKFFLFVLFFIPASAFPSLAAAENQVAQKPGETVEQEAGFYYTVKKGDTLWDLSQRFSDTPWVWPDLWE
jgi:LysM repeat protein